MIPVIWWKKCRGNWDHGLLMNIFEKHPNVFSQWNDDKWLNPKKYSHAIVIVAGRPDTMELRSYLEQFESGLVILTSEEDAYFDWKAAIPNRMQIMTQYYSPSTKSEIKHRLLLGAPGRIRDYKTKPLQKKYLWSFVGQVQNPFRQECVEALKFWGTKDSFLREVEMFGGHGANGMDYQDYLDIMRQSTYVICPAGSMCVDSFRVYEALECGAIPIVDKRSPRDPEGFNYWDETYGINKMSLIQVDNWKEIGSLLFDLECGHRLHDKHGSWWRIYKDSFEKQLTNYATR